MMRNVWAIARKELRGFFQSAVALIFLLTFLVATLFIFFWVERFFGRNLADVRPLFEWFPLLLIFLCAALSMRMWSEEQKLGTIEVLMTLPVSVGELVLGKFLAGLILVGIGLTLTLGIPITVSMMGNLDWGPVIGGYVGSMLLASAYLAVGLCISALTANQVLALIFTVLACGLLYLPGADAVAGLTSYDTGELLRALGTGSRFDNIARGVIDLRDIVYYLGIAGALLMLNAVIVDAKRWGHGARTSRMRRNAVMSVALVAVNALALNIWLAPVHAARADLTEYHVHSLSPATDKILADLDQPLVLRAYISKKLHPLVQPVVPSIRDMLREYGYKGGDRVRVEFVDPVGDEALAKEAEDDYGITTIPFEFEGKNESSVINAYFTLLVKYGDQYETIDLLNLLDVDRKPTGEVTVQLGNFEYEVTRTIKKVSEQFHSLDRLVAALPGKVIITGYFTPDSLPPEMAKLPDELKKVAAELRKTAGDKLSYTQVEPKTDAQRQEIYDKYGIKPFVDPLGGSYIYMHVLLDVGGKMQRLVLGKNASEADIRKAIVDSIRRETPGYTKTIGLWAPKGFTMPAQNQFQQPQQIPPPQGFQRIEKMLSKDHEVVHVDLSSGEVPPNVDLLVVAGPDHLTEKAQYAIDQFLMRGGTTIIFDGRFRLARKQRLSVDKVDTGLDDLLASYGIKVPAKLVMDEQAESFAVPEVRQVRGRPMQVLHKVNYPYFPRIKRSGMGGPDVITAGLPEVVMMYGSPVEAADAAKDAKKDATDAKKDAKAPPAPRREVLLSTTKDAWLSNGVDVLPDFNRYPEAGFGKPDKLAKDDQGKFAMAVALTGSFTSHFADKGDPRLTAAAKKSGGKDAAAPNKKLDRTLKQSPPGTRLVVVGSSVFVSDESQLLAQLIGNDRPKNNLSMFGNMVDWSLADNDLLSIRSRGKQVRTLDVADDARSKWEGINYGIALLGLGLIAGITFLQRRRLEPLILIPGTESDSEPEPEGGDDSDEEKSRE